MQETDPNTPSHSQSIAVKTRGLLLPLLLSFTPALIFVIMTIIGSYIVLPADTSGYALWLDTIIVAYSIVTVVSLLSAIPCFIIGLMLIIKRRAARRQNIIPPIQESTPTFNTHPKKRIITIVLISLALILLWAVIPFGFLLVAMAIGFASAMNGSGCQQNPSADHCQTPEIGLYFIIYLVIAIILTTLMFVKKRK